MKMYHQYLKKAYLTGSREQRFFTGSNDSRKKHAVPWLANGILFGLLFVFLLGPAALPLSAQTVTMPSALAVAGDTLEIPVELAVELQQICGFQMDLSVIPPPGAPVLTINRIIKGTIVSTLPEIDTHPATPAEVTPLRMGLPVEIPIAPDPKPSFNGPGILARIELYIPSEARSGDSYILKLSNVILAGPANRKLPVSVADTTITIGSLTAFPDHLSAPDSLTIAEGAEEALTATITGGGIPLPGIPVRFALANPDKAVVSTTAATTDTAGRATVSVTGLEHGNTTVQVASPGLPEKTVAVIVQGESPLITSQPVREVQAGFTYAYDVEAFDPNGDTLVFGLTTAPAGMTIAPASGLIEWLPPSGQPQTGNAVTVEVRDPFGNTDTQSFTIFITVDADGDGYDNRTDCNDFNPAINPGASELCNGVDENCNGISDEGVSFTYYLDADGDGYGDPARFITACSAPPGYVLPGGDCNDLEPGINPGRTEIGDNGIDEDCNPATPDSWAASFMAAISDNGNIYYAKSNGDGTFTGYKGIRDIGGYNARAITINDFNNDGYLDFVAGGGVSGRVDYYLFLNNGRDEFFNQGIIVSRSVSGEWAMDVTSGDFNNDGYMDFMGNTNAGQVVVALGNSRLSFTTSVVDLGSAGRGLDCADFNNDNIPDIVRSRYNSGYIYVYLGNGDGTFAAGLYIADVGDDPYGIAAADFNNDGYIDIIANAGGSGDTYCYKGRGDGTFTAAGYIASLDANNHGSFDGYDFNNDGNADIVLSDYTGYNIYFYPGNGDGTFAPRVRISTSNTSGAVLAVSAPPYRTPQKPFALITPPYQEIEKGGQASFDGSKSHNRLAGSIASWEWDFGDGTGGTGAVTSHTYNTTEGEYTVTLKVTAINGKTGIGTAKVRVRGNLPEAVAGGPYTFGEAFAHNGLYTVNLDGTASFDDTGISSYEWTYGDFLSDTFSGTISDTEKWIQSTGVTQNDVLTLTGAGAWGNRYCFSRPVFRREAELVFYAKIRGINASGNQHAMFGFKSHNTNYSYTQMPHAIYFNNESIQIYEDGTNRGSITSYRRAQDYEIKIVLRENGAYYYLKPMADVFWDLLYISTYSNLDIMQAGATVNSGTFTLDDARVVLVSTGPNPKRLLTQGSYPVTLTVTDTLGRQDTDSTTIHVVPNAPPHADPGGPYAAGETDGTGGRWSITFNGSQSSDDFGILAYAWDFDAADGLQTESNAVNPVHIYSAPGTYTVTLTVTDHALQTHTATAELVISTPGIAPVADPGGPYVVNEEAASAGQWTVLVDGCGSTDDLGLYNYHWDFGDGSTATSLTCDGMQHLYSAAGLYTLTLTVMDNAGLTHSAQTTVSVKQSDPPVAWHGGPYVVDETAAAAGLWQVQLDASASTDDYSIYKYEWDFDDSNGIQVDATVPSPMAVFNHTGVYTVTLKVYDQALQVTTVTTTVTVLANNPPTAVAGGPYTFGEEACSFGLWTAAVDGRRSSDDIQIHRYIWQLEPYSYTFSGTLLTDAEWDYSSGVTQDNSISITGAGAWGNRYIFSKKDYAAVKGAVFQARVLPENTTGNQHAMFGFKKITSNYSYTQLPCAIYFNNGEFRVYENGADRGKRGNYTRNTLYDIRISLKDTGALYHYKEAGSDSWILLYDSNLPAPAFISSGVTCHSGAFRIDAMTIMETKTGATPVFDFRHPGIYSLNLTVWDHALQNHTDTTTITILDGNPPVADAGGPYTTEPGAVLVFNGAASSDDHGIETYKWTFGDLSKTGGLPFIGTGVSPQHMYKQEGVYDIVLEVTDNSGKTATDSTVVTVVRGSPPAADAGRTYTAGLNGPPAYFDGSGSTDDYGIIEYRWDVDDRVDSNGDGDFTNDIDVVGRSPFYVYTAGTGTYTATLTVEDGAGQTSTSSTVVTVVGNLPPHVITVPWIGHDPTIPHEAYNGKLTTLKGIVRDADPVNFQWDFGDGTRSAVLKVTDPFNLSVTHMYPEVLPGTPFVATLTVWDSQGESSSDTYPIIVKNKSLSVETNIAIDDGLWYLHKEQQRLPTGSYPSGRWRTFAYGTYYSSATAAAIQAFEINGHMEHGEHKENPYVETVDRGLKYLFTRISAYAINLQTEGDPDTNGNGLGIGVNEDNPIYQGGPVMDAIASSKSLSTRTVTGGANIARRSYFDILTDMVDMFAWGQHTGGWRYRWNENPDNSAAQWGAIGMQAAEDIFGIPIPQWVKDTNNNWLNNSYDGTGFGYTGPGNGRATTPSGLVELAFDDKTSDDIRWKTAENFIAGVWSPADSNSVIYRWITSGENNRDYYAMYAFTKAMRLASPNPVVNFKTTGLDWYNDPEVGMARCVIMDQLETGRISGSYRSDNHLRTAWGVIMLSQTLFVQPPLANAGQDRIWGVNIPLALDGSRSTHLDPFREIVQYEWDFNGDGIYDTASSNPIATYTYTDAPAALPKDYVVTLRVTDNNVPPLTDTDSVVITIAEPPHPPVAVPGGPYTGTAGLPVRLDGRGSFDIDPTDYIAAYAWEMDNVYPYDFAEATDATPTYTWPVPGTYYIGLKVSDNGVMNDLDNDGVVDDNERLSNQAYTTITIIKNEAPVADAGGPYLINEGETVTFDASHSFDPNGDPLVYTWDLDNDGEFDDGQGATVTRQFMANGNYSIRLSVTDTLLYSIVTANIIVNDLGPQARFGWSPEPQLGGAPVNFTDQSLSYPDAIVAWTWDFGGLGSSTEQHPSFTFTTKGTYTVTLTVTDADGSTAAVSHDVTIINTAPIADAGSDQLVEANEAGGALVVLDGSASYDPDLNPLIYAWSWATETATGVAPAIHLPLGEHDITLIVSDGYLSSQPDVVKITVRDTTPPVLTVPADLIVEATGTCTSIAIGEAVATDLFPVTIANDAPACYPLGETVVTWTATDANGNVSTGTQTVAVIYNTPPTIIVAADITVEANAVCSLVTLPEPEVRDPIDPNPILTDNRPDCFPLGKTVVAYTATNFSGNSATAQTTVTVVDTTPPVLTVPADLIIEATGLLTPVEIGQATATDIFAVHTTNNALLTYPLGETIVTWTATDANGNIAKADQKIIVRDTTAPIVKAGFTLLDLDTCGDKIVAKFKVWFNATDLVDSELDVKAILSTPLIPRAKISYKKYYETLIKYDEETGRIAVKAPQPEAAWEAIAAAGGLAIEDGAVIKIILEDELGKEDLFVQLTKEGRILFGEYLPTLEVTAEDKSHNIGAAWANPSLGKSCYIPDKVADYDQIKIKFQYYSMHVPAGFIPDYGKKFGYRNGYVYGWNESYQDSILCKPYHYYNRDGQWEIVLPLGEYSVKIGMGDARFATTNTINIEGVGFCEQLKLQAGEFKTIESKIAVADGRLTMDMGKTGYGFTKINFMEITSLQKMYYTLSVQSGSGSGAYRAGTKVPITANPPASGCTFLAWGGDTGYVTDLSASTTELIMPRQDITLKAIYFDNQAQQLVAADFDEDENGFIYRDCPFYYKKNYHKDCGDKDKNAEGRWNPAEGYEGASLQVTLGGKDRHGQALSGGWRTVFKLERPQLVVLGFRYKLTASPNHEKDETSSLHLALNNRILKFDGEDYAAKITGGGTTDWRKLAYNFGILPAGEYTLTIGGYCNKKSTRDEITVLLLDNVQAVAYELGE